MPIERGRDLAEAIPGARFVALPTRNHIPLAADAGFEHFCQAISDFLRPAPAAPALTPRRAGLGGFGGAGAGQPADCRRLGLADKTVRNALSALYTKLAVEGRPQAVVRARELGLNAD